MRQYGVTVVDRIRALGYEPTPELSWSIGNQIRDKWLYETGSLPEKRLRPKTNDRGTQCHAVYPESFREIIDQTIRLVAEEIRAAEAAQPSLFD